ncbi:MAG: YegP family protein, partial [Burkholderiales bacterium]|nr:YegP family protein [Burkholderiales bacterium]
MNGWFAVSKSKTNDFYFVLKAGNGEVVLTSEMYATKDSADAGIASVQGNSHEDSRYERAKGSDGKFRFNLKAANHQVIGTSQMYATEATRDAGIASVKDNGKSKTVKDNT